MGRNAPVLGGGEAFPCLHSSCHPTQALGFQPCDSSGKGWAFSRWSQVWRSWSRPPKGEGPALPVPSTRFPLACPGSSTCRSG